MDRHEFYDKLRNYKAMQHSSTKYGTGYVQKIKLPNGDYRYFYSNAEYEAYLEGQKRTTYEKNKKAAEAMNKEKQANSSVNKYNEEKSAKAQKDAYKKNEDAAKSKLLSTPEGAKQVMQEIDKKGSDLIKDDATMHNHEGWDTSYSKEALYKALSEVYDIPILDYNGDDMFKGGPDKNPKYYSNLMKQTEDDPEKTKEVAKAMDKYFNQMIKNDGEKAVKSIDLVERFYHKGQKKNGDGNVYSTGIPKDGEVIAKDLRKKYEKAVKNTKTDTDAYLEFLKSLTKDEKEVLALSNDYYYNNYLPANNKRAQEYGRDEAAKLGQMETERQTERRKYHQD